MPILNWDQSLYQITGIPEGEEELKFDVYQRYLNNWCSFITATYPKVDDLIKAIAQKTSSFVAKNGSIDINYIQRFLFISWNTEYLLSFNDKSQNTDMLRINNQWKPIQAYYSIYSLAEAAMYCIDKKIENHSACIQKISEFFVNRKEMRDLVPWSFSFNGYSGNKNIASTIKPVNFPDGIVIPNSLKRLDIKPIESIACCVRAEHRNRIENWEKPKKSKTLKYMYDPGLTTLFHFLYRLRIKSNYKDAELFMVEAPDEKIKSFSSSLTLLVYATNTLLEIVVMKKIGKDNFYKLIDAFGKKNKDAPILERLTKYKDNYGN